MSPAPHTGGWGRDVLAPELLMVPAPVPGGLEPRPLPTGAAQVRALVTALAPAYVPEWTDRSDDDAGLALLRVHATLAAAVTGRLNRIPRRLALGQLELAGIRPRPATTAEAVLALVVADGAGPVPVAEGTVLTTPAGSAGPALETTHGITALAGRVAAVAVLDDGLHVRDDAGSLAGLPPFGTRRRPPAQLWIGLETSTEPAGLLSLAVRLAPTPGRPRVESSSLVALRPPPELRWEAVAAGGPVELTVDRDGTHGLTRDGVVVLRAEPPGPWPATTLPGRGGDHPLHWLRARLASGTFPSAPALEAVTLNGVGALARRTVRDEVAEPVERLASGRSRYRLSQAPVLPGTAVVQVSGTPGDETDDPFGRSGEGTPPWREVPSLSAAAPQARVFTLDPATGVMTFGDGLHGRAVPPGYRHVVATSYATGGRSAQVPAAGDEVSPERTLPGLVGATVLAITPVASAETPEELLQRGPATLRSGRRAVAAADYATAALETPGAGISRAHCLPADRVPGTLTVLVLPRAVADEGTGPGGGRVPPVATPETLEAVSRHLAGAVGVAGARVVATTPRFRTVAVTALLVAGSTTDLSRLEGLARASVDTWLHPLTGGDAGTGWPFGQDVRWDALVRFLMTRVPGLLAVSRISFRVDGRRLPSCADVVLADDELVWPGSHVLATGREVE